MTDFRQNTAIQKSIGLRSNNPGNIKQGGFLPWKGQIGTQTNGGVIFDTIENGIRALTITLVNLQLLHNANTLQKLFDIYAPVSDGNDPTLYAKTVANQLSIDKDSAFTINNQNIKPLVREIINYELGRYYAGYVTDNMIVEGSNSVPAKIAEFLNTTTGKITGYVFFISLFLISYYVFKRKHS